MLKIIVTGPESSGKTTLCKALYEHFNISFTKEYAREYLDALNRDYNQGDLLKIAKGQLQAENGMQLLDTDLITLKIWSEYKYGSCDKWILTQIEKQKSEKRFYLLCKPDIPWEAETQRENPNDREKLFEMQAFVPPLPSYFNKIKEKNDFDQIFSQLNLPNKKILFYPAQFWPHKNHIYLIKSLERMAKSNNDEFIMIFTGYDKGNKDYVVDQINIRKLKEKIFIFDYLSLEQIISLYLNCFAMTMTSLVGRSSLPLREAFYFKTPVFYSGGILDKKYASYVNELNLEDFDCLGRYLSKENYSIDHQKISNAKRFYDDTCSDDVIVSSYKSIINNYKFNLDFWKKS